MKRTNLPKIAATSIYSGALVLLLTKVAYAVETKVNVGLCLLPGERTCSYTYSDYVRNFYIYSLRLGLALAGIMVMYSGFLYLTSQGDTTKLNKAKEIFTGAALGFFLLVSVYAILNFLGL